MDDNQLGPLLRLWGLSLQQLPPTNASIDEIAPFILSLVQETVLFVDSVDLANTGRWKPKGFKTYRGREAGGRSSDSVEVSLAERIVPAPVLQRLAALRTNKGIIRSGNQQAASAATNKIAPETWICRRSLHQDAPSPGTASWVEFRTYQKDRHVDTEYAMTPTVVGAHEIMRWPAATLGTFAVEEGGRLWSDFTLSLHEMRHKVGRPVLKDRLFPVLQMTCASTGEDATPEFLVASVTLNDYNTAGSEAFTNPRAAAAESGPAVVAAYVSVEQIRLLPDSTSGTGQIEWVMATASDARGVLPPWVQAMAVPGQIAKDVPLFFRWLATERIQNESVGGRETGPLVQSDNTAPASLPIARTSTADPAHKTPVGVQGETEALVPAELTARA